VKYIVPVISHDQADSGHFSTEFKALRVIAENGKKIVKKY